MSSTVQINAYGLVIITNKAKSKFKTYCTNVNKYPFSRYPCPQQKTYKSFLGYTYETTEDVPLAYEQQLDELLAGNKSYRHPMYELICSYNESATRSRLSNADVIFSIPYADYKNIINIAEYGNY